MFNRLRMALAEVFGNEQTFPGLAKLTGHPRTTVQHWFQTFSHPHIIFLLCLLEQLPERKRSELIAEFCRELPVLNHPRLSHDPLAVGALENVINDQNAATVIRGGSEYQRTFVASALCNSAVRSFKGDCSIAGFDVHEPKKFVPVQGVIYCKQPLSSSKLESLIVAAWNGIVGSNARLLILNGVWSVASGLRSSISRLAEKRHVIIADALPPEPAELAHTAHAKVNVITLSQAKESAAWIRVSIAVV
jgi:hypothetical protein